LLNYAPSPSGYAGHVGEILDCASAQGWLLLQAGPVVPRFVSPLNDRDDELAEGGKRMVAALRESTAI
jgi:acetylornithine/succinyldiaminopimelate/putrescine aminotransferase